MIDERYEGVFDEYMHRDIIKDRSRRRHETCMCDPLGTHTGWAALFVWHINRRHLHRVRCIQETDKLRVSVNHTRLQARRVSSPLPWATDGVTLWQVRASFVHAAGGRS